MPSKVAEPVGTLAIALAHAARLLTSKPALAAEQAGEILKVVPGHPEALLMLAGARRRMGDAAAALAILRTLTEARPDWALAQLELGAALGAASDFDAAITALTRAVKLDPHDSDAWRTLADHLTLNDEPESADRAYAQSIRTSTQDPRLMEAAVALCEERLAVAERLLRTYLKAHPTDVAAIRMLAETGARLGRFDDAEKLLTRCIELAPSFIAARHNLALVLHRQGKSIEALAEIEHLMRAEPHSASLRNLKAAALTRIGEYDAAIELYGGVLEEHPDQYKGWMSYGHALKTAGQLEKSIEAYRRSIALKPGFGEAYWSLANLKTFRFTDGDISEMERQVEDETLTPEDRFHLHYALGKACEDAADYAASFQHYAAGAKLRRTLISYDADETSAIVARAKAVFTEAFFAAHTGDGAAHTDPIFIVGLPRAGSTLLEQILSSHSQVEGTMELPDIIAIAKAIGESGEARYPEALLSADGDKLQRWGESYIERTRIQRKTGRPFFIDKMPNNFLHVGLIQAILPNAKIIDARRHPMGNCFSAFKQHFARGQNFSYDLTELGRYYADYVSLMAHFDAVTPGRVHRVIYEHIVADTETEVRRLLDYCGLAFEPECLEFHTNDRAVRTPSAEQVRQPIFTDAVEHWRHYEPWLQPLKQALGAALEIYPSNPARAGRS
jgi:tetratricopeptide (TPR) repeat protein